VTDAGFLERGRSALLAGDFAAACLCLERSVKQLPQDPESWFLLGAARHRLGQPGLAKAAFLRASELDAQHLQARLALASVCLELGERTAALIACQGAIRLAPADPQAWFSAAVAQEASGLPDAALASYERALVLAPGLMDAVKNRGALLLALGRKAEAIASNRAFVAKFPYSFEAQFNLGDACLASARYEEAAKALNRAVSLAPANVRGLLHAGFALAQCERFAAAQPLLDRAAELDQAQVRAYRRSIFGEVRDESSARLDARTLFLLRHYDAVERADWRDRSHFLARFSSLIAEGVSPLTERALGFRAMAMGLDPALQRKLAEQIANGVSGSLQTPALSALPSRGDGVAPSRRRIKVAYLSPDFGNHPVGLLASRLFAWHDRSRFEVIAYALGGDEHGDVRREILAGCDRFVDLDGFDDEHAAQMIAADSVDILIDLAGYTDRARPGILARRPAPLQVSWLGYMATMGASWIDYLVADAVSLPPENSQGHSEAIIRLPAGVYLCCYAGDPLPLAPSRQAAGLPVSGLVLGAIHNTYKIDPDTFALWMRLLLGCEGSVLWLLASPAEVRDNLRAAASAYGVAPERLLFAPRLAHDAHLGRLQLADLMLDTPCYNGGATSADALAAGVPVITCAGISLAQRMAASLLHAAGQDDLITFDLVQYEAKAMALLGEPDRLRTARERLEAARAVAPFYAPRLWLRQFEAGLQSAWQRACDGLPPADIDVSSPSDESEVQIAHHAGHQPQPGRAVNADQ